MDERRVVILVGPPGAGKGTQAQLLEEEYGFLHLESSKVIEEKFVSGGDDLVIERERNLWKSGKLNTPALVRQWIMERIEQIAAHDASIVFSGSPRTLFEAEGEVPLLERLYGPEHIYAFHIDVSREVSVRRNSKRRICKANRHPIPNLPEYRDLTACPHDGSELVTRVLDTPGTIAVRYDTYLRQTAPVLGFLQAKGYEPIVIDGDTSIEAVHARIAGILERGTRPASIE
jgi:adenylate kinase